ncbi:hypothetical protein [Photobacterium lipolyticum]|uniref:Uncharacterized protein n=1 Tax=Photobacterium lipolyticum TaxID=266810 RepID=A0A2T3MPK5_9GAMM|nr:hypothetical protein [Photobacterium lipolyticum]PSV98971.1 hypothetical protein C9I89_21975 [Photobacterium lipolyticum]
MFEGIQPPHVAFYSESIRFHVESAMSSIDALASFAEMTNQTNGSYEITGGMQDDLLNHLQNLFLHSATVSRYFWPSKPGKNELHKKRAKQLQEAFGIEDSSPLKSRKLRNKLEHFDENLDLYLNNKPIVGYILPAYVGGEIESEGVPVHIFRAFYIDTGEFEVLGDKFKVQPIVDEICKIHSQFYPRST